MELTITQHRVVGDEQRVVITLAGRATIGESEKIKQALTAALADCNELLLDVGETTAVDLSLLQLIHAAHCSAGAAGVSFALTGEFSDAFRGTAMAADFLPANAKEIFSSASQEEQ